MNAKIEHALVLRIFLSNKGALPPAFLNEFLRVSQEIATSRDFSIDFEIEKRGLFGRRKNRWTKLDSKLWDEVCHASGEKSLSYLRIASPARPVEHYDVRVDCRVVFDSDRNALTTIEFREDPFSSARDPTILTRFRNAARALVSAAPDVATYGYCDIGEYGLTKKATLQVGKEAIPIFATRRPQGAASRFPDLNLDTERAILGRVVSGLGVKGIYWLTFLSAQYSSNVAALGSQHWMELESGGGLLELPDPPPSGNSELRDRAAAAVLLVGL